MLKGVYLVTLFLFVSCDNVFDNNQVNVAIKEPNVLGKVELSFKQLYNLHSNEIGRDTIVAGYVVSSDENGNFYKELYIQNTPFDQDLSTDNPRMGLKIKIGVTALNTRFSIGRKVIINLQGLKKITSNESLVLGQPNNNYLKDIIVFDIDKHILKSNVLTDVEPKYVEINKLSKYDINTFIKFRDLHFKLPNKPLAGLLTDDFDGKRMLEFCNSYAKDSIILETSNFSNFSSKIAPNKQIDISGVLNVNFDKETVLTLNTVLDLEEIGEFRICKDLVSPDVLITEVADPKVASGEKARYVEIYNPTNNQISLDGWSLIRFNKTTTRENEYSISLNGLVVQSHKTIIVSSDEGFNDVTYFEKYFGFTPDLISGKLDGNGDDAYVLYDNFKKVKDVYGEPNIDGSNSVWDYENGVAFRVKETEVSSNVFIKAEWIVKKELPLIKEGDVSVDFTPGIR